ncbi:MAG TPA: helix-turn-helix domain-containing protein, partial [Solirubrobacteraceae bacterium]|nr:helix-turn-helix domain-containing protein [Solirubrobacteraceae bacterium]
MADRLRELIDLVLGSLDEPGADGRALAERAHFSRDHLDRLLAAATGESPVGLRRRLLLERAAWQLRSGIASAGEVAAAAGYGSSAAFSRAFARAYGEPPGAFAASDTPIELEAPNGIHFHAPAGLLIPGARTVPDTFLARMVRGHVARVRELLVAMAPIPADALERDLRPGFVVVWFEGEEASATVMARRLVFTLEVWVAAMAGEPFPEPRDGRLLERLERAGPAFERIARR